MASTNQLRVFFTGDTKGLNKATKKAEKDLKGFGKTAGKIGAQLAGVFAVGAILNFTKQSVKMAATLEGVQRRFRQLDGVDLNNLQRATRGTVDNLSLMKAAVQARNFNVPLRDLGTLFEFATKRAVETGESVGFLVDSIVLGLGRKSIKILDNLGISAVELRKKMGGVGAEMATVEDTTNALIEIINESSSSFSGLGDDAFTSGQKFQSFSAAMANAQVELGKALIEVEKSTGIIAAFTERLRQGTQLRQLTRELEELGVESKELSNIFEANRKAEGGREGILKRLNDRVISARKNSEGFNAAIEEGLNIGLESNKQVEEQIALSDDQQKILAKLDIGLRKVVASQGLLGTEFTQTEDRISLYKNAMIALLTDGIDPANTKFQELNRNLETQKGILTGLGADLQAITGEGFADPTGPGGLPTIGKGAIEPLRQLGLMIDETQFKANQLRDAFEGAALSVGFTFESIGQQFSTLFAGMLQEGTLTFKGLIVGLGRLIAKLLIATGIAAAFRVLLGDASAPAKGVSAIAAIASAVGGLAASIPQLAHGGIATGATLAMIGEGREPEAVLPLSKLAALMSGGFGIGGGQSSVSTSSSALSNVASNNSRVSNSVGGGLTLGEVRLEGDVIVAAIQRTFKNNGASGGVTGF